MANLCESYPCHSGLFQGFSCELCYCPEYYSTECSGNPKWIEGETRYKNKNCNECLMNHTEEYINKYFKEKKDAKDDRRKMLS